MTWGADPTINNDDATWQTALGCTAPEEEIGEEEEEEVEGSSAIATGAATLAMVLVFNM